MNQGAGSGDRGRRRPRFAVIARVCCLVGWFVEAGDGWNGGEQEGGRVQQVEDQERVCAPGNEGVEGREKEKKGRWIYATVWPGMTRKWSRQASNRRARETGNLLLAAPGTWVPLVFEWLVSPGP